MIAFLSAGSQATFSQGPAGRPLVEGPAADIVALNAGAALYAADVADSLKEGVLMAQDAQGTRLALEKMKELAHFTRVFAQ